METLVSENERTELVHAVSHKSWEDLRGCVGLQGQGRFTSTVCGHDVNAVFWREGKPLDVVTCGTCKRSIIKGWGGGAVVRSQEPEQGELVWDGKSDT